MSPAIVKERSWGEAIFEFIVEGVIEALLQFLFALLTG